MFRTSAEEFLEVDLKSVNSKFDAMNTWTLSMVRMACQFAEAYEEYRHPKPKSHDGDLATQTTEVGKGPDLA